MISLEDLEKYADEGVDLDQYLLPMDSAILYLQSAEIDNESANYFSWYC